jgi:acyl CoA:acetate/3-ketoacid CoA transferase alpha subunit
MKAGKFIPLQQAAEIIPDDVHIAIGGFTFACAPMAFEYELIRQHKKGPV